MSECVADRLTGAVCRNIAAALRHEDVCSDAEIERQSLGGQEHVVRILKLVMDMKVRLAARTGIAGSGDDVAFCDLISDLYLDRLILEMPEYEIGAGLFDTDEDVVSEHRIELVESCAVIL